LSHESSPWGEGREKGRDGETEREECEAKRTNEMEEETQQASKEGKKERKAGVCGFPG
jgi:hypothetical protein